MGPPASHLLSLPDEVIEEVALRLPLKDRVAFLSASKRLHGTSKSSQRAWAELQVVVDARHVLALGVWLHGRRQQLRHLAIHMDKSNTAAAEQLVLLVSGLNSHSLRSLSLRLQAPETPPPPGSDSIPLGGWLAEALPGLEELAVHGARSVAPSLSQLTRLTRLDISTRDPSALAPGCLPSRLVSLLAVGVGGTSLLAGPLPRLQSLRLSLHPTGLSAAISRLTALPGLTSLGLGHTIGLRGPPAQLAALTNLQYLLLEIHPEEGVAVDFTPLLALGQLSHLTLRADGLSSLPVNVLALPKLKRLNLVDALVEEQLPHAAATQLEQLCLDFHTAAASAAQLAALSRLLLLELSGRYKHFGAAPAPGDVEALLRSLAQLRSLVKLELIGLDPAWLFASRASWRAYNALLQRWPDLVVKVKS